MNYIISIKWILDWQPTLVIYTWLQVTGVSVTDPSLSDLSDLLLLMSASLVSFFIFSPPLAWAALSICHLSLERKKMRPPSLSLSLSPLFVFFFSLSHTPTYHLYHWQAPAHPTCCMLSLRGAGWSITWFDGSYYRPGFPGQDAGIFIEADKGSSKTSHPPAAEDNLTQVWFIIIFLAFQGNVKYDLLPPPSSGERLSVVIANFKPSVHLSGMKMNPLIWLTKAYTGLELTGRKIRTNKRPLWILLQHAITFLCMCCTRRYKRQWKRLLPLLLSDFCFTIDNTLRESQACITRHERSTTCS